MTELWAETPKKSGLCIIVKKLFHPKLKLPHVFFPHLVGSNSRGGFDFGCLKSVLFDFFDAAISYPRVYFIRLGLTNSFIFHHLIVLKCDYTFKFIYITITQPN